jgi:signal transduction histidine kinase
LDSGCPTGAGKVAGVKIEIDEEKWAGRAGVMGRFELVSAAINGSSRDKTRMAPKEGDHPPFEGCEGDWPCNNVDFTPWRSDTVKPVVTKEKMSSGQKLRKAAGVILACAYISLGQHTSAGETNELLTNAAAIISLPVERAARQIKVLVTGTVTAVDATFGGSFFVQDATCGVYVDNRNGPAPEAGDVVRVSGVTEKGAFAPVITGPTFQKIGRAPLPPARAVSIDSFVSGTEDSQRVEVSGIVRSAQMSETGSNLDLAIASGAYRFHAFPKMSLGVDPQSLIGARVRLRGTSGAFFNQEQRRLTALKLFMTALPEDFVVEAKEPIDPFTEPLLALNNIAQYRKDRLPGQRIHVKGTITYLRPGQELFLQDQSGGLRVVTRQIESVSVGDVIEVAGFADIENFLPVLQDAVFRKTSEPRAPVPPKAVTLQEVQDGLCHADLITLRGKLLDGFIRRDHQPDGGKIRTRTVLMMQSENLTFTAETEAPDAMTDFANLRFGSTIEVSGVCFTESGEDGKAKSFQILMPNGKGVRVLAKPSWLTPQRLLTGLGILLAVSIVAVGWTVMVSKKNATLKELVREKENARLELRQAHDQLEERVKERTAQLKLQITARKELELQSKATLAERTRLAQELHDTLEQSLTGVALQLDTTTRLYDKEHEGAKHHLDLARNLVAESQMEVHRSVWNLRCRALEQFDLPGALLMSSQQITGGSSLRVEMKAHGRVRPLPETVEENLLRIAQEALTNVIKHSGATLTEIDLDYGPKNVVLKVTDNGKGFALDDCAGPSEGHFGLLGIYERVKRLQGQITFSSAPASGTTVRVQIPIPHDSYAADRVEPQLST